MKHTFVYIIILICATALFSCSSETEEKLERIKTVGNDNPELALAMLDSLDIQIRDESEYIKMKYDLLKIRLNDKAYHAPISDITIKKCISYFESAGSDLEKQEVYYYAGSVYRDLHDTPKALSYFLKSTEQAMKMEGCDSVMLANTYSNMNCLYYDVQDYANALAMAKKELDVCKRVGRDITLPLLHIGTAYIANDKYKEANIALDDAFTELSKSGYDKDQESLLYLLRDYSRSGNIEKANRCYDLLDAGLADTRPDMYNMTMLNYFSAVNQTDSAIYYCKKVLTPVSSINYRYDATKSLFALYYDRGDIANACRYGIRYMQLSDSIDFGKRQEMMATVNNQFQYHLDKEKEEKLKLDSLRYKALAGMSFISGLFAVSLILMIYIYKRNRHLKKALRLVSEMERVSGEAANLRSEIETKEKELQEYEENLAKSRNDLESARNELNRVNRELDEYSMELKNKERQLSDKMEQNKAFLSLLHKSELEGKAEDIVYAIRQSATGKKDMSSAEWKQLYQAVDELYPMLKEQIVKELGHFTEQQLQVCYLMRIGLSKAQIQSMTNLSRVTVWRWVKKFSWILGQEKSSKN